MTCIQLCNNCDSDDYESKTLNQIIWINFIGQEIIYILPESIVVAIYWLLNSFILVSYFQIFWIFVTV